MLYPNHPAVIEAGDILTINDGSRYCGLEEGTTRMECGLLITSSLVNNMSSAIKRGHYNHHKKHHNLPLSRTSAYYTLDNHGHCQDNCMNKLDDDNPVVIFHHSYLENEYDCPMVDITQYVVRLGCGLIVPNILFPDQFDTIITQHELHHAQNHMDMPRLADDAECDCPTRSVKIEYRRKTYF